MARARGLNLDELKLEKLSDSLDHLLLEDAFKLPERKLEEKKDDAPSIRLGDGFMIPIAAYQELYGKKITPIWGFKPSEEKKAEFVTVDPARYRRQFNTLLDKLAAWGATRRISQASLSNLNTCKSQFFHPDYSGDQTSHYFISCKQNLEKIWYILAKNPSLPEKTKLDQFTTLCQKIGFCPSGVFTHIFDTAIELSTDPSVTMVLAIMRKNITDAYAKEYSKLNGLDSGNEVHVSTALYSYQQNQKWGPVIDITKIRERYGDTFTNIDATILTNYHDYFERSYPPRAIIECICKQGETEIQKERNLINDLKEDKQTGWMPYNQQLMDAAIKVAKYIGVDADWRLFLDLDEKSYQIRYTPELFQAKFLKFCKEKKKFFKPYVWKEINLNQEFKEFKIVILNENYSNIWIEDGNRNIINWNRLPDHLSALSLFSTAFATTSECFEETESKSEDGYLTLSYGINQKRFRKNLTDLINATVKDLKKIIHTRKDLEEVMTHLNKDLYHFTGLIYFLDTHINNIITNSADLAWLLTKLDILHLHTVLMNHHLLKTILTTDKEVMALLTALPPAHRWKFTRILKSADYPLLENMAKRGDVLMLKELLKEYPTILEDCRYLIETESRNSVLLDAIDNSDKAFITYCLEEKSIAKNVLALVPYQLSAIIDKLIKNQLFQLANIALSNIPEKGTVLPYKTIIEILNSGQSFPVSLIVRIVEVNCINIFNNVPVKDSPLLLAAKNKQYEVLDYFLSLEEIRKDFPETTDERKKILNQLIAENKFDSAEKLIEISIRFCKFGFSPEEISLLMKNKNVPDSLLNAIFYSNYHINMVVDNVSVMDLAFKNKRYGLINHLLFNEMGVLDTKQIIQAKNHLLRMSNEKDAKDINPIKNLAIILKELILRHEDNEYEYRELITKEILTSNEIKPNDLARITIKIFGFWLCNLPNSLKEIINNNRLQLDFTGTFCLDKLARKRRLDGFNCFNVFDLELLKYVSQSKTTYNKEASEALEVAIILHNFEFIEHFIQNDQLMKMVNTGEIILLCTQLISKKRNQLAKTLFDKIKLEPEQPIEVREELFQLLSDTESQPVVMELFSVGKFNTSESKVNFLNKLACNNSILLLNYILLNPTYLNGIISIQLSSFFNTLIEKSHLNLVKKLLEIRPDAGDYALHLLPSLDICKILIHHNVNLTKELYGGCNTFLSFAADEERFDIVEYVVNQDNLLKQFSDWQVEFTFCKLLQIKNYYLAESILEKRNKLSLQLYFNEYIQLKNESKSELFLAEELANEYPRADSLVRAEKISISFLKKIFNNLVITEKFGFIASFIDAKKMDIVRECLTDQPLLNFLSSKEAHQTIENLLLKKDYNLCQEILIKNPSISTKLFDTVTFEWIAVNPDNSEGYKYIVKRFAEEYKGNIWALGKATDQNNLAFINTFFNDKNLMTTVIKHDIQTQGQESIQMCYGGIIYHLIRNKHFDLADKFIEQLSPFFNLDKIAPSILKDYLLSQKEMPPQYIKYFCNKIVVESEIHTRLYCAITQDPTTVFSILTSPQLLNQFSDLQLAWSFASMIQHEQYQMAKVLIEKRPSIIRPAHPKPHDMLETLISRNGPKNLIYLILTKIAPHLESKEIQSNTSSKTIVERAIDYLANGQEMESKEYKSTFNKYESLDYLIHFKPPHLKKDAYKMFVENQLNVLIKSTETADEVVQLIKKLDTLKNEMPCFIPGFLDKSHNWQWNSEKREKVNSLWLAIITTAKNQIIALVKQNKPIQNEQVVINFLKIGGKNADFTKQFIDAKIQAAQKLNLNLREKLSNFAIYSSH